jgi:hypothetical protein
MKYVLSVVILIGVLFGSLFVSPIASYAASSTNYYITAEVIDLGGAVKSSTNYKLISKLREMKLATLTSNNYTQETTFVGLVYGTGSFSTFEAPVLTSITPNSGNNDRDYTVIINGSNISWDAVAKLTKGGTDIVATSVTIDALGTSMEATFSLVGADVGTWNLVVTNVGMHSAYSTLVNAFTVMSAGELRLVGTPINDPNPFNPSKGPTHFVYKLSTPASISLYLFNQKGEIIWQKDFSKDTNGGSVNNDVVWNGMSDFKENVPTGVYILKIVTRSGGVRELGRIKVAILRQ